MAKTNAHIHKYQKAKLGNFVVFKCMLPGCPHYIRRELVIGRESICWNCNTKMILTMANTVLKRPTHEECRGRREAA